MSPPLLMPSDLLRPRRVDEHFAAEAAAARAAGATVARLDHDALLAGHPENALVALPPDLGPIVYRGWMIPATDYAALAAALPRHGATLHTSPTHYRTAHELPGWYPTFADLTPRSGWLPCPPNTPPTPSALATLAAALPPGPGIVKDYVKSRKHDWHEACHIPDLADTATLAKLLAVI